MVQPIMILTERQHDSTLSDQERGDLLRLVAHGMAEYGLFGSGPHDMLTVVIHHATSIGGGQYAAHRTATVLAGLCGCTPRTIRNWIQQLREIDIDWLKIGGSKKGMSFLIDAKTECLSRKQVGNKAETSRKHLGSIEETSRKQVGKNTDGTESATHTGVTITPPSDTTYPQKGTEASERASDDLKSQVRGSIQAAGWMSPTDFNLEVITKELVTALANDEQRMAFVREKLAELSTRDNRPGLRLVEKCLREDCHGWQSPADRPRRVQVPARAPASKDLANTVRPTSSDESLKKLIDYGTRNQPKTVPQEQIEAQARAREAERKEMRRRSMIEQAWRRLQQDRIVSAREARAADSWEKIEARLREIGAHPEQRGAA